MKKDKGLIVLIVSAIIALAVDLALLIAWGTLTGMLQAGKILFIDGLWVYAIVAACINVVVLGYGIAFLLVKTRRSDR